MRASPLARASIAAALLVILRSAAHVFFAASHLDSDQAIFGIMGLDIVRGEPLPFYTYGQQYLLALEAYFAAPFFALTGASVISLKLPLVVLNILTAFLMIRSFRAGHVTIRAAFVAALPFVLPSVFMARTLVAAHGCNIEPFVAVVALFALRDRPVLFGLVAGIFYLNREFTAYALPALVLADIVEGRRLERAFVLRRVAAFATMAAIVFLGRKVGTHGPHYFGTPTVAVGLEHDPLHAIRWLFADILPVVAGATDGPAPALPTTAASSAAHHVIGVLIAIAVGLGITSTARSVYRGAWRDETTRKGLAFPAYLVGVAVVSSAALVMLGGMAKDVWSVRYDYLALLGVSGAIGAFFATESAPRRRQLVTTIVGAASAVALILHLVALADMVGRPPAKERVLAQWLVDHGYESGRAEYWTAYATSFLSKERVMITATGARTPIQRYEDRYRAGGGRRVEIANEACSPEAPGEQVLGWCVRPTP